MLGSLQRVLRYGSIPEVFDSYVHTSMKPGNALHTECCAYLHLHHAEHLANYWTVADTTSLLLHGKKHNRRVPACMCGVCVCACECVHACLSFSGERERVVCGACGVVGLEYNMCMMQHWPGNVVAAQEVC